MRGWRRRARVAVAAVVGLWGCLAGCSDRRPEKKEPHDSQRVRRVIEPSTERVGPLPPYAIRADGVGPYKLGEKLSDLLERLASGPRIALFEIPGVVHRNVIRAEDDSILIGGEQASTASFVAVVGGEVARTESGVHVGSTRDELIAALGAPAEDPERARDPRLIVPSSVPSLHAILDAGRVAALVVQSAVPAARRPTDCARPAATDTAIGACLTAAGELVEVRGDEIAVRSAEGERALAPVLRLTGVVFVAALRSAADARDELVVITRSDEAATRTWWLATYRLEGARLARMLDASALYQLSTTSARWIGADLRDVELYLELTSRPDAIEVGGLLTTLSATRAPAKIRDVVVIAPASVPRRRARPAAFDASDAGSAGPPGAPVSPRPAPDAAVDAPDPAGTESGSATP